MSDPVDDNGSHPETRPPSVKRLFVAVPIPLVVADRLLALVPNQIAGVRPLPLRNLHLTLHFVGNADPAPFVRALEKVRAAPFTIEFDHLGKFGSPGRGFSLWIGLEPSEALTALHESVSRALHPVMEQCGAAMDDRAYRPHVTLARCGRDVTEQQIQSFLKQRVAALPSLAVNRFCLYSSMLSAAGSSYFREKSYPLDEGH